MSVMFILLPVALAFAAGALGLFLWAARTGQFDDLDTPPVRILAEDDGNAGGSRTRGRRSFSGTGAATPQRPPEASPTKHRSH